MSDLPNFSALSDDDCWDIICERDVRYDGVFVIGVTTTGVYCRPGCPARMPHRKNVIYFPNCELAETNGFRPCLRCRPDERPFEIALVEDLCRYIDQNLSDSITLTALSNYANVSIPHLHRLFKRILGITPRQYLDSRRFEAFTGRLKEGDTVTTAMYAAGYGSSSRIYERVPSQLGMTPIDYQRGGKGISIEYAIVDSAFGRLLVAATERGICAINLADSDPSLEQFLETEFPAADIQNNAAILADYLHEILGYLDGNLPHLDLPLDIRVTAFQRRVLDALVDVPYGQTATYNGVARNMGHPKAARAIAKACATNLVPLAVPSHRVIRDDGALDGHRLGVKRQAALIDMERSRANSPPNGTDDSDTR